MVQDICIVDRVLGLSETFSEMSGFDNCSHWRFRAQECVGKVPGILVLREAEAVVHLFHSSPNSELLTVNCS